MEWVIVTLLIIVILIINHNFKKITRVITRYDTKLTELEAHIAELEGKPKDSSVKEDGINKKESGKDYNHGLWKKYPNA